MIRPLLLALLCVACGFAATGCKLNKYGASDLEGEPDSSGLVVVDSQVDVLAAVFGLHSHALPSGGLLTRADGERGTARAGTATELLVFSDLHPGRWQLVSIDADWAAGRSPAHETFSVPAELAQAFTFDVRVGEPVYLGVVRVEDDRRAKSLGVRFELKPDPEAQKKTWEKLVEIYGDGPWGTRLRAKL